jgi:hypothetical protein
VSYFANVRAVAFAGLLACNHAPIQSCDEDLHGVYRAGSAAWMLLDNGTTLEAYPLFDDFHAGSDATAAPRAVDLRRSGPGAVLTGETTRRYDKGPAHCRMRTPAHVTACKDDTLELVVSDPVAPRTFDGCVASGADSHVERWVRE